MEFEHLVRDFDIVDCLSKDEGDFLVNNLNYRRFKKYDKVFTAGQECNSVFFLQEGGLKIVSHRNDKELIKAVVYPKRLYAEWGSIFGKLYESEAIVIDDNLSIYELSVPDFQALMKRNSEFSKRILALMSLQIRNAERRLESLIANDARARIVEFLKDNALQVGQRVGYELLIRHNLTQQDIANITGTSRQTVTSVLNQLKKSNQIYFKRKSILIRDVDTLS